MNINKKHFLAGVACLSLAAGGGVILSSQPSYADNAGYYSEVPITTLQTWMNNTGGFTDVNFFDCVTKQYMVNSNLDVNGMISQMGNDGFFSDEDLGDIESLPCTDTNTTRPKIENINGINRLTSLKSALLGSNTISSVSLLPTSLEGLYLSNNPLVSVDLAGLVNLSALEVLNNTDLTELDVTENVNLRRLYIQNSGIDQIDLSKNNALTTLWANGTRVKTSARAYKDTDSDNYIFNISDLGFICEADTSSCNYIPDSYENSYNSSNRTFTISNRNDLIAGFSMRYNGTSNSITLDANPALITATIYIDDTRYNVSYTSDRYINETWDSNDELESIRSFIDDNASLAELKSALEDASLTRVEAFQTGSDTPNENVGLSEGSTATHLFGTIPSIADPNITLVYYYETPDTPDTSDTKAPSAPETGLFTKSEEGLKTNLSLFVVGALATFVLIVLGYIWKRQRAKARIRFQRY